MIKSILLGVILISFFALFSLALAQEAAPASPSPSPVEYALPYPGMLPDNPLYFIKIIRDRILAFLITNPLRKVEFQQLMADKHLNMGLYLIDKDKDAQALGIIEQGVVYLEKTNDFINQLPQTDADQTGNTKNRFKQSLHKHAELLSHAREKINEAEKDRLAAAIVSIEKLQQEVKPQ